MCVKALRCDLEDTVAVVSQPCLLYTSKTFKTALSLLMALALVMSLAVTAFAQAAQPAADIVYQGEKKLVITPTDGHHTDTDLFGKFKGVMPGDNLTETITFKNESTTSRTDYGKLYIVAVPHGQDKMCIRDSNNGDTVQDAKGWPSTGTGVDGTVTG